MDNIILEIGLALVLIAFAVALAHKLGLSNVPFLIIIGMVVGPHAPQIGVFDFRFIETGSLITYMGRIGVLFLLFYLGLESNVSRLIEAGRSILTGGALYVGINFTVGFTFGYLAGFPLREALIIAGAPNSSPSSSSPRKASGKIASRASARALTRTSRSLSTRRSCSPSSPTSSHAPSWRGS